MEEVEKAEWRLLPSSLRLDSGGKFVSRDISNKLVMEMHSRIGTSFLTVGIPYNVQTTRPVAVAAKPSVASVLIVEMSAPTFSLPLPLGLDRKPLLFCSSGSNSIAANVRFIEKRCQVLDLDDSCHARGL
jgi:hypothetical protein